MTWLQEARPLAQACMQTCTHACAHTRATFGQMHIPWAISPSTHTHSAHACLLSSLSLKDVQPRKKRAAAVAVKSQWACQGWGRAGSKAGPLEGAHMPLQSPRSLVRVQQRCEPPRYTPSPIHSLPPTGQGKKQHAGPHACPLASVTRLSHLQSWSSLGPTLLQSVGASASAGGAPEAPPHA